MNREEFPTFDKILVAYDGSKDSQKAVRYACALALEHGSQVTVIHVYGLSSVSYQAIGLPQSSFEELDQAAKEAAAGVVSKGVTTASEMGVRARSELIRSSSAVESIVDYAASSKFDLIVIGTRGNTGFKRLLLGSVSSGVVQHSSCPVLVVR